MFFYMGKQSIKNYLNIELQIIFGCLLDTMDIMRRFFIFGVPVKINSFSPIPEDDEELSSRTDLLGIFR